MGNWNVTSLNGKEQELVWEAEQYYLDIVEVSSTKCYSFDTIELNESCKFFYSSADVTISAQTGVCFLQPRLALCVTNWIPLKKWIYLLKLRLQEQLLVIFQMFTPNAEAQCQPFLDELLYIFLSF